MCSSVAFRFGMLCALLGKVDIAHAFRKPNLGEDLPRAPRPLALDPGDGDRPLWSQYLGHEATGLPARSGESCQAWSPATLTELKGQDSGKPLAGHSGGSCSEALRARALENVPLALHFR